MVDVLKKISVTQEGGKEGEFSPGVSDEIDKTKDVGDKILEGQISQENLGPLKEKGWTIIKSDNKKGGFSVLNGKNLYFISSSYDARFTDVFSNDTDFIATCANGIVTLDYADKHNKKNPNCGKYITWKSESGKIDPEIFNNAKTKLNQGISGEL